MSEGVQVDHFGSVVCGLGSLVLSGTGRLGVPILLVTNLSSRRPRTAIECIVQSHRHDTQTRSVLHFLEVTQ